MGAVYASVADITVLKSLTASQMEAAEVLLPQASAMLRQTAKKYGKNLDELVTDEDYAFSVKNVVVQSVCRALDSLASASGNISQGTESIGAYSLTATYFNAGQSLYFLKSELKLLGLKRQIFGAIDLYHTEE